MDSIIKAFQHVYKKDEYVSCVREDNIIKVIWYVWGSHELVKECCEAQLQQVRMGVEFIIVDTSFVKGTIEPQTSVWLEDFLFPAYENAGLKAIITIQSADVMARLSNRLWNRAGSKFSFDAINVSTLVEAFDYIQQNP